eukprot:TRINITY_DN4005_c0_g2_i1.p1 TRINITY_DN4005_c0_g2~~TRINITY_DN4005_c0_g2_i1.p1  ORF type:complete len:671 (+),score=136.86 TRINITY_DN4005_c0_g2_i1:170-2182(+)
MYSVEASNNNNNNNPATSLNVSDLYVEDDDTSSLSSLFQTSFPSNDPTIEAYLSELTSMSLARLAEEPQTLKSDAQRIKVQMQELAFTNYKSFIQTAQCIKDVFSGVKKVSHKLKDLNESVVPLASSCASFGSKAQTLASQRSINRMTLLHHPSLLDLLEVPQLMDTCVRNGYYDEALQLQTFVKQLAQRHPNLQLLASMKVEVESSAQNMLSQLLLLLRSQIQLPQCLKTVGYLRRLGVYDEMELRITFLSARSRWLDQQCQILLTNSVPNIESGTTSPRTTILSPRSAGLNINTYLSKLADLNRTHLFEIITQYRATFSDDTSSLSGTSAPSGEDLLHGWITQRVSLFIEALETYLPHVSEGSSLQNLLDACMYFGQSLGRVGADFRGILPPLFQQCILQLFSNSISQAANHFSQAIRSYKFQQAPMDSGAALDATPIVTSSTSLSPPHTLLSFPPVAVFTNAILSAFNELRQCAPLGIQHALTHRLRESLITIVAAMQSLPNQIALDPEQEKGYHKMCKSVSEVFLPYISKCWDAMWHSNRTLLDTGALIESLGRIYGVPILPSFSPSMTSTTTKNVPITENGVETPENENDNNNNNNSNTDHSNVDTSESVEQKTNEVQGAESNENENIENNNNEETEKEPTPLPVDNTTRSLDTITLGPKDTENG